MTEEVAVVGGSRDPVSGILMPDGEETCDRVGVAVVDQWLKKGHSREWSLL